MIFTPTCPWTKPWDTTSVGPLRCREYEAREASAAAQASSALLTVESLNEHELPGMLGKEKHEAEAVEKGEGSIDGVHSGEGCMRGGGRENDAQYLQYSDPRTFKSALDSYRYGKTDRTKETAVTPFV